MCHSSLNAVGYTLAFLERRDPPHDQSVRVPILRALVAAGLSDLRIGSIIIDDEGAFLSYDSPSQNETELDKRIIAALTPFGPVTTRCVSGVGMGDEPMRWQRGFQVATAPEHRGDPIPWHLVEMPAYWLD